MITAFIDSSVFFAACLSQRGASYEILHAGVRGQVLLVISDDVVAETTSNLAAKVPQVLPAFQGFLEAIAFVVVNPTTQAIAAASRYTYAKDAPIVAAAKTADVDYLVSLDRKHLVGVPAVSQGSGLTIVLPEDALAAIRRQRA